MLAPRFSEVAAGALYAVLAALVLLLPLGWLAGKRLAEPLSHLLSTNRTVRFRST